MRSATAPTFLLLPLFFFAPGAIERLSVSDGFCRYLQTTRVSSKPAPLAVRLSSWRATARCFNASSSRGRVCHRALHTAPPWRRGPLMAPDEALRAEEMIRVPDVWRMNSFAEGTPPLLPTCFRPAFRELVAESDSRFPPKATTRSQYSIRRG